ncbi:MAG TPA: hypothetical protein VFO67_18325 [Gemmatimonadales bacterium]|nr:hypothetical protein [Gemmatimonadales bacterium]
MPLATAARPARAQCDDRIVSAITIVPRDPSFLRFPRVLRPLARGVGLHHTTTKPDVIRGFLLLHPGRPCTERLRAESERILRFQPFLADADVRAVPDGAGGVRIEVETIDEIPTVFAMRFQGGEPAALRIGNGNVGGRGVLLALRGERGFTYRNGVGVQLVTYQAFGGPYTFAVVANRTPLGSTVSVDLGHPFITDLQPTAWHVGFREVRGLTAFVRPEGTAIALGALRRFADVGAVLRVGVRGHSAFIGGLITDERVTPASQAVIVSDSGLVADTSMQLAGPFASVNNTRLNAVVGVSSIVFLPVRGFDALLGTQDVAKGVQLSAIIGHGVSWFGAGDHDLFLAGDAYAGVGSAMSFAALRVEGEWRQDRQSGRWESVVGSGRLAWYFKPVPAAIVIGSAEFSGGWRWQSRFPFQLRLGDREGGVRGYSGSRLAGAVRNVGRLEVRRSIGRVTRHVALGLATFVDAGRVWAGDAPFGVDSRTHVGVGAGLLAAIPPRSRQLWRLVFAVPVSPDPHARWELRFTVSRARGFWREPGDVARARAGASPATIFTWP